MVERLHSRRPDAVVRRLRGVGHYPMVEVPDAFNSVLAEVLA
jgi:pimeloyl-ACP methyl ester carboxylesterase